MLRPAVPVGDLIAPSGAARDLSQATNLGPAAASSLVVTDSLPTGMTYVSASATGARCTGSAPVTCSVTTSPAAITIVARATTAGTVINTATATSATKDPNSANNSASASVTVVAPPPPPGTTRDNPIPLGTPVTLPDGWRVTVTSVFPDATAAVLAANIFNDPPMAGYQFFMIAVSATYLGAGSSHLDSGFRFRAVGSSQVVYTTFENSCGVLPKPNLKLDDPEVFYRRNGKRECRLLAGESD